MLLVFSLSLRLLVPLYLERVPLFPTKVELAKVEFKVLPAFGMMAYFLFKSVGYCPTPLQCRSISFPKCSYF